MNRANNRDLPNFALPSTNGASRISKPESPHSNGNNRRSPITTNYSHQQPQSYDTLGSVSTSFNSEGLDDPISSIDEENILGLTQKFHQLQQQVELLTETQTTQDERYKRTRRENDELLNKINDLEDQIRELEFNSEARAKEDERRFKESMAKEMKMRSQECEQHLHANFLLQQEIFELKSDLLKNETLIKSLRCERDKIESELQDKIQEMTEVDQEVHRLKLLVRNLKDEEAIKANLISILNEELEDSQNRSQREQSIASSNLNQSTKHRVNSSRRSSVTSGYDDDMVFNAKALKDIDNLEATVQKVKSENAKLKERNEELQAQILNIRLEEGMSLVQESNKSYSLADEMGDIDVQKLVNALREQQDDNARLRKYMDEILLKIVEKSPEILDRTVNSNDRTCDQSSDELKQSKNIDTTNV